MQSGDNQSFDPRTWAPAQPAAAAAPPATRTVAGPAPRPASSTPLPGWLAPGAPLAILAVGAIAALLARPDGQQAPGPVAVPAAVAEAGAEAEMASNLATRTLVLSGTSGLQEALADAGIADGEAAAAAAAALGQLEARTGEIRAVLTLDIARLPHRLVKLAVSFEDSSGALVSADGAGGFSAVKVAASLNSVITAIRGEMDAESFYSSAVAAGVTDTLIPEFARAFAFDFDFQREIRPGDIFEAAFEQQVNAAGRPVGQPKLLYASMATDEKSRALYWFQPDGEDPGWFDGNGSSIVRSLMRTPVDGARVTSMFGIRRHPILGYQKRHNGTDFAAPIGTAIYASGNAVVEFAGPRGAAGNFINLRHDNGWNTWYMHLNAFAPGLGSGLRVRQGQQIGEIGTTGRSTGPHLHYEVRIEGEPVDPLGIQTESGRTLSGAAREAFIRERDRIDVARAARSG